MEAVELKPEAKAEFVPEAAYQYATEVMGWNDKLPKKLKNADTLREIVEEEVERMLKGIPEEERYVCDACEMNVGEPDDFCWYCGADITGDETGGFVPSGKDLFGEKPQEVEEKKVEEKKATEKPKKEAKPKAPKPKPKSKKEAKAVKEEKKEPEKKEPEKKELEKADEKKDVKSLKDYTAEIRRLDQTAGSHAWLIGMYLTEVKNTKAFKEGGFATLADYVKGELDYSWQTARNFMRYASIVTDQTQAAKLGVYKMEVIARCPEEGRPKMLKAALPKPEGQGNTARQLEDKLKVEKEKRNLAGQGDKKSKRGRKPEPNKKISLHDIVGQSFKISIKDGIGDVLIPESECIIEAKLLKQNVVVTFYQLDKDDEEE